MMMSFTFCLLSIVIAANAEQHEDMPVLSSPTSVKILKDSSTTVLLVWDFEKPRNVSLPDIEFIVVLESRGKPISGFHPNFKSAPFNITLGGLTPFSQYTVRIHAAKPNWRNSPTVKISFSFPLEVLPILKPPTNLRIGKGNDTWAVLVWDHLRPQSVSIEDVAFIVLLQSDKEPRRYFSPRFKSRPFSLSFYSLTPKTRYTVEIQASAANWQDSPIAEISFTTPEKDWPAPVITEVHSTPRDGLLLITVTWTIGEVSHWLQYYRIDFCAPECYEMKRDKQSSDATMSIKYQTELTIRVVAVYDLPFIGLTTRSSPAYSSRTSLDGFMGGAAEIPEPELKGFAVLLPWLPFYVPHGPTPYYEFFVSEKSPPTELTKDLSESGQVVVSRNEQLSDLDHLVEDFDMSLGYAPPIGVVDVSGYELCLAPRPLKLVVVKRLRNAVRFRVIFKEASSRRLVTESDSLSLKLGPSVAEYFDFAPFTPLSIVVRSCLTNKGQDFDLCGKFSQLNTLSNVARPSSVRSLVLHPRDRDSGPRITWDPPGEPHGPINGYRVLVQAKPRWRRGGKMFTLDSKKLTFVLDDYIPTQAYKIGVAAFNLDLENPDEAAEGEWAYVNIDPPEPASVSQVFFGFLLALVVFGAFIICERCSRPVEQRNRTPPPEPIVRYVPLRPVHELLPPEDSDSLRATWSVDDNSLGARSGSLSAPSSGSGPPAYDDVVGQSPQSESDSSARTWPRAGTSSAPGPSWFNRYLGRQVERHGSSSSTLTPTDRSEGTQRDAVSPGSHELAPLWPARGFASESSTTRSSGYVAGPVSESTGSRHSPARRPANRDARAHYTLRSRLKKLLLPESSASPEIESESPSHVASQSSESDSAVFTLVSRHGDRDGGLPRCRAISFDSVSSPTTGIFPPPPSMASGASPLAGVSDSENDETMRNIPSIPTDSIASPVSGATRTPPSQASGSGSVPKVKGGGRSQSGGEGTNPDDPTLL